MAIAEISVSRPHYGRAFTGLSSDTKPTSDLGDRSTFWETDTGITYIWDGTIWRLLAPVSAIKHADSAALDAFGRLRISAPFNVFESQFNYDLQPLFFEESLTGTGAVSHVANSSAARLSTGGTASGAKAIFGSRQYFRYQPGKSQSVVWTCILGTKVSNVRKRIGYFDSENGFFFEQDGSNFKIVRRTKTSGSVVDNAVNQSVWNLDALDGTGPSGITLDEANDNIYIVDFQWLGAGRIRYGLDFGGQVTYVHEIKFANTAQVPFTTTGNLPFRAVIENTDVAAGTTTFDFTCLAIASESGFNPTGIPGSAKNAQLIQVTAANDPLPILSIRNKATFNSITNRGLVIPKSYELLSQDSIITYDVILNGSLTGASFNDVNTTNSMVEFDIAATAIIDGLVIDGGFLSGGQTKNLAGNISEALLNKLNLANNIAGDTGDILSIVVSIPSTPGTASDCAASFTWKEER